MAILPKAIYIKSFTEIENDILHRDRKINPKSQWKHKRLHIAKAILSKIPMLEESKYLTSNDTTEP
jgi:hypothetical protein